MTGLWADGWFYISSAGLLVSGALFFFLLGQYRAAAEAADMSADPEPSSVSAAINPVLLRDTPPAPVPAVSSVPHLEEKTEVIPPPQPVAPPPAAAPAPAPAAPAAQAETAGAVAYLRNMKEEIAELKRGLATLSAHVDEALSHSSSRDEALVEKLGELAGAIEKLSSSASAPAPRARRKTDAAVAEPAPAPAAEAPAAEPAAPPAPVVELAPVIVAAPAPEAAPAAAQASSAEPATDLSRLVAQEPAPIVVAPPPAPETTQAAPAAQAPAAPAAAPAEPAPEEKPRRGPVWPV